MQDETRQAEARKEYGNAYSAHYTKKNLGEALDLYRQLMTAHPDTPEAGYAGAQIRNIAHSVVPRQELIDAQAELAHAHLVHLGRV